MFNSEMLNKKYLILKCSIQIFNPHMLHKSPVVDLTTSFQHVEVEPIVESSNLGIIESVDNYNQQNLSNLGI